MRYVREHPVGWALVFLIFAIATAHLLLRGPIDRKGTLNLCDFANHWGSARLLVTGQNPYPAPIPNGKDEAYRAWISSPGAFETDHVFWLALLPPGALVVLAPLASMPAGSATFAWGIISLVSIVAIIAAPLKLARIPFRSLTGALIGALALLSAPVHTLVSVGQISLPVIAMILLTLWCARDARNILAGLLLGIAAACKPQLAAPFFLWFLCFGRWRLLGVAVLITAALNLAAIVPMQLQGHPWLSDWIRNVQLSTAPGGPNDPTSSNPWRNHMIDLRVWLFTLFDQRELVVAKGLIISLLLAVSYVALLVRRRDTPDGLLPLATLCALTLLPVYHRAYDAALLLPALAWAVPALKGPQRRIAIATLAALSVFLVPWDFTPSLMRRTSSLDALSQTWLWRVVIFPHYALATIATAGCLLWAMGSGAPARVPAATPNPAPRPREPVSART